MTIEIWTGPQDIKSSPRDLKQKDSPSNIHLRYVCSTSHPERALKHDDEIKPSKFAHERDEQDDPSTALQPSASQSCIVPKPTLYFDTSHNLSLSLKRASQANTPNPSSNGLLLRNSPFLSLFVFLPLDLAESLFPNLFSSVLPSLMFCSYERHLLTRCAFKKSKSLLPLPCI
jgi:hypothetical protein